MALEEVRSRSVDLTFPDSSRGGQEGTRIYQTIFLKETELRFLLITSFFKKKKKLALMIRAPL